MYNSPDFPCFRQTNISVVNNGNCAILVVGSIRFSAVLGWFEFRKSRFLPSVPVKVISESTLKIELNVCKCKTVYLLQIRKIFLVLRRCYGHKFPGSLITLDFFRKHEVIYFTATAKRFGKHDFLFRCWIKPVFDRTVHNWQFFCLSMYRRMFSSDVEPMVSLSACFSGEHRKRCLMLRLSFAEVFFSDTPLMVSIMRTFHASSPWWE